MRATLTPSEVGRRAIGFRHLSVTAEGFHAARGPRNEPPFSRPLVRCRRSPRRLAERECYQSATNAGHARDGCTWRRAAAYVPVVNVRVSVVLERKHPDLAAFVVVPAEAVAAWGLTETVTVEGALDGVALGRRSLVRWDDARWFIELRRETLAAVSKGPGDTALLDIHLASTDLPAELEELLRVDGQAKANWDALTPAQQRMLREDILTAKAPATRERRARNALACTPATEVPRVEGLPSSPTPLLVRIVGSRLPGRACGPYTDVRVGMPQRVGCDPVDTVLADAPDVTFETRIQVLAQDGAPRFRGPAVNGPPAERFLYLTWLGRKEGAESAMFRRAKLRLDAVPADVLVAAVRAGTLVGELDLTDCDGMPLCASIRPPVIRWSPGPGVTGRAVR